MRTEDGRIIQECLNGEREAFGVLVDKYKEGIYAFVYARLRDFRDAQDVTQEVFLQAYRGLRKLRRSESFAFWLYRIAYVCCAQWLRASSKRVDREFTEDQPPKAMNAFYLDSYRADQLSESVREALDSLPEAYREVLMLHYFGGMNSSEMARALGTSPVAIRKRLSRARAHLKEEMISAMGTALEQQRLRTGFTFHIIEAIKRIKIHPTPRMTGLPWGLSLAAGIIFTILNFSPSPGILAPGTTNMAQSPGHAEMVRVGEIPVDVLTVPEEIILPGYPGELHGEDPGRLRSQGRAASSMAPAGQEEYTFVRSWPEELLGVRYAWVSVDGSGRVYVADVGARRIQKFDSEGNLLTEWGTYGSGDGQFNWLQGITTDDSGNIYAVDRHRVQKFDPDGNFLKKWGTEGSGDGQFNSPNDLTVDDSGNVYVTDSLNYRVQKFDPEGNFLLKWGTVGADDGQFVLPKGIAVDGFGNVYVADYNNNRIQVFDSEGNFLRKWGTRGQGNGQFYRPYDLTLDDLGDIYVVDSGNSRIQKFDSQGNFLKKWGSLGVGEGQLLDPMSVAIDSSGNVYVTQGWGGGVDRFDSEGKFLKRWGKHDKDGQFCDPYGLAFDNSGNLYVADTMNNRIQKFGPDGDFLTAWGTFGAGNGQFYIPLDVAVDSSGNVYTVGQLTVPHNHRIQKFDSEGRFLESWGTWGQGNGQLNWPQGIEVDSSGTVYVADTGNNRIQVFDSKGNTIASWGTEGGEDGQFRKPEGIDVDSSGNVYVVDKWNFRIQVFDSKGKFLRKWGTQGDADGQFFAHSAIAVDNRSDKVYVADTENCRIQVFDTKGNFLAKWGTYGTGDMELSSPHGIAVSSSGDVYVSDTSNHRIKVYRPVGGGAVEPGGKQLGKWGHVKKAELLQNFPNPFNPETWIPFTLSEPKHVTIRIYGSTGQLVRTLDLGQTLPGAYLSREKAAYWDGRNETGETAASDVYFYAMEADGHKGLKKMVLAR